LRTPFNRVIGVMKIIGFQTYLDFLLERLADQLAL